MIITIRQDSGEPIYLQIYGEVVRSIAKGILKYDEYLPSSRRLAKDLGINYHTVSKAYQLLEMEGFVRSEGKKTQIMASTSHNREEFISRFDAVQTEIIYEARAKGFDDTTLLKMFQRLLLKVVA